MRPDEAAAHIEAIREMVDRSRHQRARTGDVYIAWGLVAAAALGAHALLDQVGWAWPWAVWFLLLPLGGAYAAWRGRQEARRSVTYASRVEARTWLFASGVLAVLCGIGPASGTVPQAAICPLAAGIIAVAMGTASELYRDPRLLASGVLFLAVALACLFVPWQAQFGLLAAGLIVGYVVPGWLLVRAARADG